MKTAGIPERGKSCKFCKDTEMSKSRSRGVLQGTQFCRPGAQSWEAAEAGQCPAGRRPWVLIRD